MTRTMDEAEIRSCVLYDVAVERDRQEVIWKDHTAMNLAPTVGLTILVEEVGEVAKAILEDDGLYEELIQVAAVACAMAEGMLDEAT